MEKLETAKGLYLRERLRVFRAGRLIDRLIEHYVPEGERGRWRAVRDAKLGLHPEGGDR